MKINKKIIYLYKIFILFFCFQLIGCIEKSNFDTLHSGGYELPWDFNITETIVNSTSVTIKWSSSLKAKSYSLYYKRISDADYLVLNSGIDSPFTLTELTTGQQYNLKIRAHNSFGVKETEVVNFMFSTPPVAIDIVPSNILAGSSRTITLNYTDTESDQATSCELTNLSGLTINSACACNSGICTVGVLGAVGHVGSAEFEYTVSVNNQRSNGALVSFDYICPSNYISVNSNASLGSTRFCVMQFEAKNVSSVATSQASNLPWVNLTYTNAETNCSNLGSKYFLISNLEWMAISRAIEEYNLNWSSLSVGVGMLNSGHSDSSFVSNNILAVTNVLDSFDGTGNSAGSGWDQKRTHTLSNGNIIWDFSGNIQEWVDWNISLVINSVSPSEKAFLSTDGAPIASAIEFSLLDTLISGSDEMFPNSWRAFISTLNSSHKIGTYTAGNNLAGGYARRGGHWYGASDVGVYQLDLQSDASSSYSDTGFRCVYRP